MKKFLLFILLTLSLIFVKPAFAQEYVITDFNSHIELQKNTDLIITETIKVNFNVPKHGIYRKLPVIYSAFGETINSRLKVIGVSDENGNKIPYKQSLTGQEVELKIGDADKTIVGNHIYVISYQVLRVVRRFGDHDEIYWNVTGSNWDTNIERASVVVESNYAEISNATCFASVVGTTEKACEISHDKSGLVSVSKTPLGYGSDFTIVAMLARPNVLSFPNFLDNLFILIVDNWGYLISFFPLAYLLRSWYKKGRDLTYGKNLYYGKTGTEKPKSIFMREHLPSVYMPVSGLTPAQIGTLVDERVDIHDIVAEIVELARLGHLKLEPSGKKDYKITRLNKDDSDLLDYQKYLIEKLFPIGTGKSIETNKFKDIKFYEVLPSLKTKIYKSITDLNLFDGNPETVRQNWLLRMILVYIVAAAALMRFESVTGNVGPLIVLGITCALAALFVYQMPRRSADGYAKYRDLKGLANYLKIGKWRHEIYEKNLFLEELIPVAISLGVISRLAKQMADLGLPEPKYYQGINAANFHTNMSSSILASAPKSTSSGWSGGSGFSGGSGGGFGGGGGGSW